MEKLPDPLICLTLQHIIDQPDAVEMLMREHTSVVEKCIPLAIREVFNLPVIPSAGIVFQYLTIMWCEDKDLGYVVAAYHGFTRLLPVINALPKTDVVRQALYNALSKGDVETVKYLLTMPNANNVIANDMSDLLTYAILSGSPTALQLILSLNPTLTILKKTPYRILQAMTVRSHAKRVVSAGESTLVSHAQRVLSAVEIDALLTSLPLILSELRKRMSAIRYGSMMRRLHILAYMHKIPKVKEILVRHK